MNVLKRIYHKFWSLASVFSLHVDNMQHLRVRWVVDTPRRCPGICKFLSWKWNEMPNEMEHMNISYRLCLQLAGVFLSVSLSGLGKNTPKQTIQVKCYSTVDSVTRGKGVRHRTFETTVHESNWSHSYCTAIYWCCWTHRTVSWLLYCYFCLYVVSLAPWRFINTLVNFSYCILFQFNSIQFISSYDYTKLYFTQFFKRTWNIEYVLYI